METQQLPKQHKVLLERCIQLCQALFNNPELERKSTPVLTRIMDLFQQCFEVERCSLALWEPVRKQVHLQALIDNDRVQPFWLALGQGITGKVIRDGEAILSNDVSKDSRFDPSIDRQTGWKTQSIMCVPLKHDQRVIGALAALNTAKFGGFTEEDLDLLLVFGGLLGQALVHSERLKSLLNARLTHREANQNRYTLVKTCSPAMQAVIARAEQVAPFNTTVLITGESGTGKEVIARAIHRWSPRGASVERVLVPINCMAFAPGVVENELFGHEPGAFTGANTQQKGKLELAEGSTLFLDEIGELSTDLQITLLRVLDEKCFRRLGGTVELPLNIRLVAATNRDLSEAIQQGKIREDFYFRIAAFTIHLPPLRERREDIPTLIEHYMNYYRTEMGLPPMEITPDALALLQTYKWPGNIRELKNVIEGALVLSSGRDITPDMLPEKILNGAFPQATVTAPFTNCSLEEGVIAYKRARIQQALKETQGNQRKAAQHLGVAPGNLAGMLKRLGITAKRVDSSGPLLTL